MKLLRTIRLDRSDTFVFERAAEHGEWAVPGGFMFWDCDPAALQGKVRAAFRSGFMGVSSAGHSTLTEVAEATDSDREAAIGSLARVLVEQLGAPDLATARAAATEEIAFAQSLCTPPVGTVVALQRSVEPDGEVRERFRTLTPTLEPDGNTFAQGCVLPIGVAREEGAPEEVDLVGMLAGREGPVFSSPLAGEVARRVEDSPSARSAGGGDGRTTAVGNPPTPNPSPRRGEAAPSARGGGEQSGGQS